MKKQEIIWNDKMTKEEIFKVMWSLNIDRMPTDSEITRVTNNHRLSQRIQRTGGYSAWADKLNLKTKDSETKTGLKYEEKVSMKLKKMGIKNIITSARHPYDIYTSNGVKIDVKSGRMYTSQTNSSYYTFNIESPPYKCDIFILVKIDLMEEEYYIIPSNHLNVSQISMGQESKYNKYKDRWDYLKRFESFYKGVKSI